MAGSYMKILMIIAAVLAFGPPVTAIAETAGAEQLGRLFTDARQRQKLDSIRRGTYKEETEVSASVSSVRVDGLVIRSDGHNVVWVNGQNTLENKTVKGVKTYPQSADATNYKVPVKIDGNRIKIKPGQSWSDSTGTVKDNY